MPTTVAPALDTILKLAVGLAAGLFSPKVLRELRMWYRTLRFGKAEYERDLAKRTASALERSISAVEAERDAIDRQLKGTQVRFETETKAHVDRLRERDQALTKALFSILASGVLVEIQTHNLRILRTNFAPILRDALDSIKASAAPTSALTEKQLFEMEALWTLLCISPELVPGITRQVAEAALVIAESASDPDRALGTAMAALAGSEELVDRVGLALKSGSEMPIGQNLLEHAGHATSLSNRP